VQVEGGVLHVDKSRIETSESNQLHNLWVSDPADMSSQSEAAFPQNPLDPVLFHVRSLGCSRGSHTSQAGDDHVGIHDIAERM
jgi:hypothetical protein